MIKNNRDIRTSFNGFLHTINWDSLLESETKRLPYSYPCDNYMDIVLSNSLVRKTLYSVIDNFYGNQVKEIEECGQIVTETNFPRLFQKIKYCCNVLSINEQPVTIVTSRLKGINALSVEYDENALILISKRSTVLLSDGELQFMLGHELGHIASGNIVCHTIKGLLDSLNNKSDILGPMISDLISIPLNNWYRCTEFTADRAGYLCCMDFDCVKKLFEKLFTDMQITASKQYGELFVDHPLPETRLRCLFDYVQQLNSK